MLKRTRFPFGRPPPVIGLSHKARYAGIDDNPTITHKPWGTSEPLMAEYGWERGKLPKFRARSPFHRQNIARRMVTEMIRKDYCIVGGARAPALRILADHVVELAKAGDTDSRQHLAYFLHDPLMVDKAFDEYPRRFKDMNGKYAMMTRLKGRRRADGTAMYFVEYKNRDLSDNHKGEDYSSGPERFFLPPRIVETEKGIQRPPHMQMAFDRWASKFKTEEFHHWWRLRHAKLRFWGVRNVPHPSDVDPLWTEKEEEEWHNEMLANTGDFEDLDLENDAFASAGEGGEPAADGQGPKPKGVMPLKKKEEVCGKPTQYNVRTCEYDWKYLPDTHFDIKVLPRGRRFAAVPIPQPRREKFDALPLQAVRPPRQALKEIQVTPGRQYSPPLPTPSHASVERTPSLPRLPSREVQTGCDIPVTSWSHEEIRQRAQDNDEEAHRRYLFYC